MFMSRVALRRDGSAYRALAAQLARGAAYDGGHALVSMLFPDETERSFIWRDENATRFSALIVSRQPPADDIGVFEIRTKPYDPALADGDVLQFVVRANPVVRRRDDSGRLHKHDVAMHALREVEPSERASRRVATAREAVWSWFVHQGQRHGFDAIEAGFDAVGSQQRRISRGRERDTVEFTSFDLAGSLTVRDPAAFTAALYQGIGSARAYGCGLLLVRRV